MYKNEWKILKQKIENEELLFSRVSTCSPKLHDLLILAEDHRFKFHCGVDPIAIGRAFWRTKFCNRKEGGSTIAMQLVRVLTGRYEKTLSRKLLEISLATKLTKYLSKREIIDMYLSVAYYGWKMNGLNQACIRLDINSRSLDKYEAASLIARLKYPQPETSSPERVLMIKRRAHYILDRSEKMKNWMSYGSI